MDGDSLTLLTMLVLGAAVLYSSVGHAGASGYLAAMALFSVAPAVMKPTALALNTFVAIIATVQFRRAGCLDGQRLWPFVVTSVPFAWLGGFLTLPGRHYKVLVGCILLYSAFRLWTAGSTFVTDTEVKPIPLGSALLWGATIGLLSGLTGTGGGIFLSPLLLFMGWAETRNSSGMSAAFILCNSIAGLCGHLARHSGGIPTLVLWLAPAAIVGGWLGSTYGSSRIKRSTLRKILGVVLLIAGLKMIWVR